MDVEDESDTCSTIFAPEPGALLFKVKSFDDFLKFFSLRDGLSTTSLTLEPACALARSPLNSLNGNTN